MMSRTQITLDPEIHRKAKMRAEELGISFAEYVRRVLERELGEGFSSADPSVVFNLGRSRGSDVARDKDRMVGEAVARERDVGSGAESDPEAE